MAKSFLYRVALAGLVGLGFLPVQGFGQARIGSIQADQTIYVDAGHPQASDLNSGLSKDEPLLNLHEALARSIGTPTRILVSAAPQRVASLDFRGSDWGLVIEPMESDERFYIRGSVELSGATEAGEGIYAFPWAYGETMGEPAWERANVTYTYAQQVLNMTFVDGQRMVPVEFEEDLVPGSFLMDPDNARILIAFPEGKHPDTALVEAAKEGVQFGELRDGPVRFTEVSNVIIRGMVVEHFIRDTQAPMFYLEKSEDILIEDSSFEQTSGVGLGFSNLRNVTFRRVIIDENGQRGGGSPEGGENILFADCVVSNNSWRTGNTGMDGHDNAGLKFLTATNNLTFLRTQFINNNTNGIWMDWAWGQVRFLDCEFIDNVKSGIWLEMGSGPAEIDNCLISGNLRGVNGYGALQVKIRNTVIADNSRQIELFTDARKAPANYGYPGGRLYGWEISHSRLAGFGQQDLFLATLFSGSGGFPEVELHPVLSWLDPEEGLIADDNAYFLEKSTTAFFRQGVASGTASRNLFQYQQDTGLDGNSVWETTDLSAVESPLSSSRPEPDPEYAPPKGMVYEAESASFAQSFELRGDIANASQDMVVYRPRSVRSGSISFTVNASQAGSYLIRIRYGGWESNGFSIWNLTMNGDSSTSQRLDMLVSTIQGAFDILDAEVELQAGQNTLELSLVSGSDIQFDYLELVSLDEETLWNGLPVTGGNVDLTGENGFDMGILSVELAPFVWSYSSQQWLYVPDGQNLQESGMWAYFPK